MRGVALGVGLLLAPGAAAAVDGPTADGVAVAVETRPVDVRPAALRGLASVGAWVLTSEAEEFGGISGLLVEDGALLAVTDQGTWLSARLERAGGTLDFADARIAPLTDPAGRARSKSAGDAEALAAAGDAILVAFEQDHRIERHLGAGRTGEALRPGALADLPRNEGIEALVALPDGTRLAIAEARDAEGGRAFRIAPDGALAEGRLPGPGPHKPTGADLLGPDGQLWVVWRHFSPATGVSIRVTRHALGPDGWPGPGSELVRFESESGIDNMEAIALDAAGAGRPRLWLVSDDNFSPLQRTLLVLFEVTGE